MIDKAQLSNFALHGLLGSNRVINQHDKYIGWLILLYMGGLIIGEIIAFMVARDFIQAYPDIGERLRWAVTFAVTNCQLLLWLGCLAVFALTRLVASCRS
jgi:hypothetical protein